MSKINDVLERILPLSARRFKQETGDLWQMMERQAQQLERKYSYLRTKVEKTSHFCEVFE